MNVYAIGDLHLSNAQPKAMDIFGEHWKNHFEKISVDWSARVTEEDVVLVPGDISWAMKLEDARPDLEAVCALPGTKILIKGNHDYWWGSMTQVNSLLHGNTFILQNNSLAVGDYVFCGTRGWMFPQDNSFGESDRKIYEREKIRLKMSLDSAEKQGDKIKIVMMHYPPVYENIRNTEFHQIIQEYDVREVVFGHLHGDILKNLHLTDFKINDVNYNLVSADYLDFKLKKII
ncbi:ser/threonine protein phosphatase [Christensenellaceae bacterium]|nr:ser/threonine protein phosphatase [Christensenellaceae bacterium]BDF61195.1 ser/threonine protein phosphatase [Christensenellaceae bacterium]